MYYRIFYKKLFIVLALCWAAVLSFGQGKQRSYTVGEKVPDFVINNVMNDTDSNFKLSDFKGKLLIIDFWGTYCSSCIEALPKLDSLQQVYKGRIKVFTVTNFEKADKVKATLKRYPKVRDMKLPVVLNGEQLKKIFPHELVSHVVWIGGDGVIKAITGTEYVTASNIAKVLNREQIKWPVKRDWMGFDYNIPLIDWNAKHRPDWVYNSGFSANLNGVDGKNITTVDSLNKTVSYNCFNGELTQYCAASVIGRMMGQENPKDVVLEVKDPTRYFWDPSKQPHAEWEVVNTFCYSYTLPEHLTKEQRALFLKRDLTHWLALLGIWTKKEKRAVKCLVIKANEQATGLLKSKSSSGTDVIDAKKGIFNLNNSSFSMLKDFLNYDVPGIPKVFDETGIDGKFKFDLNFRFIPGDIESIRKGLKAYGLDVVEEMREREMYVITEDDWKSSR